MRKFAVLGLVSVLAVSAVRLSAGEGKKIALTPANTKITFVGTKPNGKHDGGFAKLTGAIENVGPGLKGSKISVNIDCTSLHSDNAKLTTHLKSPDFFEVKSHPTAKFVSTAIEEAKGESGTHSITGDLTLRGVKKSITIPATVKQSAGGLDLVSEFTISKKDFGMTYGEGKIDDEVKIKVTVKTK